MYTVGDKVEVRARLRDGTLCEKIWKVWLIELIPRKEYPNDPLWAVKFTRNSHSTLIKESMIEGKISSGFEGYRHN